MSTPRSRRGAARWTDPEPPPRPELDVLIPTVGRRAELAVTLAGLAAQDGPAFAIVVSDQSDEGVASAPAVRAMVRVLEAQGRPVRVLGHLPRRGMAEQRQFLLEQATAARVLYLDDDVWLEPGALARLDAALTEYRCGFVGYAVQGLSFLRDVRPWETQGFEPWERGRVHPELVRPGTAAFDRWPLHNAANPAHLAARLQLGEEDRLAYRIAWVGGCALFDRAALLAAGGFDFWPQLPSAHAGEDRVAQWRVMEIAGGAGILPSGAVHLEAPTTVRDRRTEASDLLFPEEGPETAPRNGRGATEKRREERIMSETPNPIQVQKFLGGVDYPAEKADLVRTAKEAGADDRVIDAIDRLEDRRYDGPTEVSRQLADA